jgi:2-polyprenyl-3-methyl-5-hydroxy-6-metoxy-1,4-benzoquinol methylase
MRAKGSKRASEWGVPGVSPGGGVRNEYADHPGGAEGWYRDQGAEYRNPHAAAVTTTVGEAVSRWPSLFAAGRVLDFCCGSGEVTRALLNLGVNDSTIDSSDPFTGLAFAAACPGRTLTGEWTFADVEHGALAEFRWNTVVCSYAFHLCEQSRLAAVCTQLSSVADHLVIVTPHKRPEISPGWGFTLVDEHRDTNLRVRLRRYDRT